MAATAPTDSRRRSAGPSQRTHAIPRLMCEHQPRSSTKGDRMGFAKIIALDLGKFKTVCCVMDVASRAHAFETIEMSPADVHDLLVRHVTDVAADTLVAFEACDCAGWVHDVATALGTSVIVVNANDERWRWRRVKRKTDRDDALKMARRVLIICWGMLKTNTAFRAPRTAT